MSDGTATAFPIAADTINPASSSPPVFSPQGGAFVSSQRIKKKKKKKKKVKTADSGGFAASHAVARPNMSSGVSGPPVSGLISKPRDPISEITRV